MEPADPAQALLRYEAELADAGSAAEAAFVAVNRLGTVLPFRMAVLLLPDAVRYARVASVSHLYDADENAPFAQWLSRLVKSHGNHKPVTVLTGATVDARLADDWTEWLPEHVVLLRLASPAGVLVGWLLVAFEDQPEPPDLAMLQLAGRPVALVLAAWQGGGWWARVRRQRLLSRAAKLALVAILLAMVVVPVRLSALAPAEVTPIAPASVAAPVDGVLAKFLVPPNTTVKAGTIIAAMDDTVVRNRHAVALKGLEIARAEYARAGSKAFGDDQSRAELLTLKARMDEKQAEVAYNEDLLHRIQLRAPVDGLVIYSTPDEWVGRALVTGERIATVANPRQVNLTLHVPAEDAILAETGADVRFFQHVTPLDTLEARLTQMGYETQSTVDAGLAYVLRADFVPGTELPRLGLRGTAKVYGPYVPLGYYLLRRPIGSVLRFLGV